MSDHPHNVVDAVVDAKERGLTWRETAEEVNTLCGTSLSGSAARGIFRRRGKHADIPPLRRQKWQEDQRRDTWILESNDSRICTVDDAISKANVDLNIWEVERVVVNGYDVTMKLKRDGKEEPFRSQNQQIKVWLRRKLPKPITDAAEELVGRMAKHAPKYPVVKFPKIKDPHLLEVSCFDVHFGSLAWGEEVGEDYDLKIAEQVFVDAVDDLLVKSQSYPIERILFPLGQDFLHIDDTFRRTAHDTQLSDVDSRYAKILKVASMACIKAIDRMSGIAPVDILAVPGNHDRQSAWTLCWYLDGWYRNCKQVTVDLTPTLRKYYRYGTVLLGFTHGDEERQQALPAIMASEAKQLWAETEHHEWHIGHWHKKRQMHYLAGDTHVGVSVRVLPSLSGTDYWHYTKGYVNKNRAAEAYLWSKERGYTGHFSTGVVGG